MSTLPSFVIFGGQAVALSAGSNLSVVGTGLWHSTSSSLDVLAYIGANDTVLTTNHLANNTAWVVPGPDVAFSSNVWTVKGLQGFSVANTTPGNAQVLTWSSSANSWGPQSLASMGFVTNTAVTGTGLWFTSTGSLTGSASLGTADQVLATSHAGTGLSWYTPSGDATFSQGVFKTIGLQGFAVANTTPTSNQVLTYNGSSWIPATFNSQNNFPYLYRGEFGDGSDANVTFDGVSSVVGFTGPVANVYTQTRAVYFQNATLSSNIKIYQAVALGYIHVRDTFTWNGTIHANGASAVGTVGGTNPTNFSGGAGGGGGAGNVGGSNAMSYSIAFVTGGSGGNGGAGSGGGGGIGYVSNATILTGLRTPSPWLSMVVVSSNLATSNIAASELILFGGTGGGGGGSAIGVSGATLTGGGGGAGGGISGVFARVLTGNGTQQAIGGAGGTGGASGATGGGGGGGGGTCLIVYGDKSGWTGSQSVSGGAGAAGAGGGSAGSAGSAGSTYMIGQLG